LHLVLDLVRAWTQLTDGVKALAFAVAIPVAVCAGRLKAKLD
jgi:hypothetical protein